MCSLGLCRIKDPSGSGKMIDDYWGSAQKLLADPLFVKTLKVGGGREVPSPLTLARTQT